MDLTKRMTSIPWWLWIAGIDLIFICVSIIFRYLPDVRGKWSVLIHFNLAAELNLAAWWSGISLLILGLLAYELFCTRDDETKSAWLILSIILTGLSFDEISSIHERVGYYGGFIAYVPFALGGITLLAYAFIRLFREEDTRKSATLILTGFIVMSLAAPQEYIEHRVIWPYWFEGIRLGLEEGSELLGMFFCFLGIVRQIQRTEWWFSSLNRIIPNPYLMKHLPAILISGLVAHLAISIIVVRYIEISIRGNPAAWYPSAAIFLLFSVSFWNFMMSSTNKRIIWLLLAALFLVSSVAILEIIFLRPWSRLNALGPFANFYVLSACQLALLATFYQIIYGHWARKDVMTISFLAIVLLAGFILKALVIQYIIAGIFALFAAQIFLFPVLNDSTSKAVLTLNSSGLNHSR